MRNENCLLKSDNLLQSRQQRTSTHIWFVGSVRGRTRTRQKPPPLVICISTNIKIVIMHAQRALHRPYGRRCVCTHVTKDRYTNTRVGRSAFWVRDTSDRDNNALNDGVRCKICSIPSLRPFHMQCARVFKVVSVVCDCNNWHYADGDMHGRWWRSNTMNKVRP